MSLCFGFKKLDFERPSMPKQLFLKTTLNKH